MMNEDQTEKIAQAIAGKLKRAVNANLPLFILVYYDHEADKLACIDALKQAVKQSGMNTRTFDPARHPGHGTGKLYPLLAAAVAEKSLCLISGLPVDEKNSLRADNDLIHYLNIYRDRIPQEKIRMVLFLHSSHAEQFIHAAGDLWDFRHGIYHLERKPDEQRPALWETIENHTARLSLSESEKKEIETHIRKTRPVIDQTDNPVEKAALLLDLTQWLFRRYAYAPAVDAAFEAIEHIKGEGTKLRADIEHWLGYALYIVGSFAEAILHYGNALEIQKEIGDKSGEGTTLNNISQIYDARGDYATALTYLEQSLEIRREIGDKSGEGITLNNISQIFKARGDYATALTYLEQSLEIQREIGDKSGEGTTLNNISQIYDARGDYATALTYLEQSLEISREIGDKSGMARTLHNMAHIALQSKDLQKTIEYWSEALNLAMETRNAMGIYNVARGFGNFIVQMGEKEQGRQLLNLALQTGRQAGFPDVEKVAQMLAELDNS